MVKSIAMTLPGSHPPEITLPRLLGRQDAASLLEEFDHLLPGCDLAMVEMNGRVYAGHAAWQEIAFAKLLAQARGSRMIHAGQVFLLPLVVQSQPVGALAARANDNQSKAAYVEDVLRSIQVSLKLIFAQALGMSDMAMEFTRLHREEVEQQRIEEELSIGHRIQLGLLPLCCPEVPGWEFAAAYCPAQYVGGDLYDFIQLPNEPQQLGLLIADVTGKGIPAALLMAFSRAVIRNESMNDRSPATILQRANHLILEDVRSNLFLSAFYARLDAMNGRLVYANGGHDWPLWLQAQSGEIQFLTTPGKILGLSQDAGLEERTAEIGAGDILVFYTDGVTETRNPAGEFFDEQGLIAIVQANANASAQEVADAIYTAVVDFADTEPLHDDIALVVVKRCR